MKAQVFLQSELLNDIEVIEIETDAGYEALHKACMAKLAEQPAEQFFLFIEDDDDERPFDKLTHIPDGLRVQLHRLKGFVVFVCFVGWVVCCVFRLCASV